MLTPDEKKPVLGTAQHDVIAGTASADLIIGLAGDDKIDGKATGDTIYGDFAAENLLKDTDGATSFDQYGASGNWIVGEDDAGNRQMTQTVNTLKGAQYEVSFEVAANYASGNISGMVEVLWNNTVIGTVNTDSAVFSDAVLDFQGTGEPGELTFRALPGNSGPGYEINTDGPVFWYEKQVELGGEQVTVKAFAEGQANIYQVMDGQLNVFDPESETYTPAGAKATVVVNAIGFNQQDDLIYGIAVKDGVDARGEAVSKTDLVMYDAEGNAYRVGETPYRSWTGDFDDKGNLWVFEADFDRVTMVDVDQRDTDGNPLAKTFKFPTDMIGDKVWDVAFDTDSQSFYGLVKPKSEGGEAKLMQIDVSAVAGGGEPQFSTRAVTGTEIDGTMVDGVPAITFGAFVIDGDGNFYAGGNGGDHDMNDATGTSGGIYRVELTDDGAAQLVLVSDAPKAYSNDGAVDPRAMDPFTNFDPSAMVLIRGPELYEAEDAAKSYDDTIDAGAGNDEIHGGYGTDLLVGASLGDTINGDDGADALYGGAGPQKNSAIQSFYDDDGLRFDQFGNLLPEDDDSLFGGEGDDLLDGSAGHDTLSGGGGNDTLSGGSGLDTLFGGLGEDVLSGGRENDMLYGEAGNDSLDGGSGNDMLDGGNGADQLTGSSGDDTLRGGAGDDSLEGGSGADTLEGGIGNDALKGGSGNDALDGGTGDDKLDGGKGDDSLTGGDGADYIKGGSGADDLRGGDGKDYLNGGSGDDVLNGGEGADRIYLGAGEDVASGGGGSDRFIFRAEDLDGSRDTISDFVCTGPDADILDLRGLGLEADGGEWIANNVQQNDDGSLLVDLGGATVYVQAQYEFDTLDVFADSVLL
ncbi:calcium-binding protein [Hoeflea prorocentri]|uniref:Calcium-binding protein n=1 Tax=Hoeflea prorocentri TaxID=1922333 RepID=A0A9X3UF90_9HYPH|nr:calcium-binding protein [Hoeflea prorocentri]MCY6379631.1 calcium-binding protein [Hoeflea prorocentri]MDA5397431.1 calcium-binding protein [Hoeflea prorocentri]